MPIVFALPFSWRFALRIQMSVFPSIFTGAVVALLVLLVGRFDHLSWIVAIATFGIISVTMTIGLALSTKIDRAVKELKEVPHKEPPASFEG